MIGVSRLSGILGHFGLSGVVRPFFSFLPCHSSDLCFELGFYRKSSSKSEVECLHLSLFRCLPVVRDGKELGLSGRDIHLLAVVVDPSYRRSQSVVDNAARMLGTQCSGL